MKYVVVVDAGSSGSRAYVYRWAEPSGMADDVPHLVQLETRPDWIHKIQPGISTFVGKSKKEIWQEHLKPLMQNAQQAIPRSERSNTPVFFLATAGLRLLEPADSSAILGNVCGALQSYTPFNVPDCKRHVAMIDGETEGLYGWLGLNYLIHTRDGSLWTQDEFDLTYGFMDMGGASTQIAFVPNKTESERHHDDLYTVSLRTSTGEPLSWKLFVTTWLGFGANQAQARWRQSLADAATPEDLEALNNNSPLVLSDPCLQSGAFKQDNKITVGGQPADTIFYGHGDFKKCEAMLEGLLNQDKQCKDEPCLFDGIHVPAFDPHLQKFVGVSEYWYSAQDLFKTYGKFDYGTFLGSATAFCERDWSNVEQDWESGVYDTNLDKDHLMQGCFKSAWVLTVLHKGFKFPLDPVDATSEHNFLDAFQSTAKINNIEVTWTLGKALMYASSQIPASLINNNQVGFVSDKGFIMTEEPAKAAHTRSFFWLFVVMAVVAGFAWVYRKKIEKNLLKGYHSLKDRSEPTLPEAERSNRPIPRPSSRLGTPFGSPFELADMSSFQPPGGNRGSPVHPQFNGVSSSVPVSRAPSRVSSRLNITTMEEE